MKTSKHPRELSDAEAEAIVAEFDAAEDHTVIGREAGSRIEAAVLRARRDVPSWAVIGSQLGMTRQGPRQRFERLSTS